MPYNNSRLFLVTMYSSVSVLALPANFLTLWLTLLQVRKGNVLAIYMFCLALCELLYASTLPLWVMYIWNNHHWALGDWGCRVAAYVFFCNIYVSILFLCCISCDRFMAVVYPLQSRAHCHQKVAIFVSATVFVLVGTIFLPVFRDKTNNTCFESVPVNQRTAGYYYSRFTLGFALPLSIITFTNLQVFRRIRQSISLSSAQKARIKRLLVAVVTIFLICFTPYHLVLLARAITFSYYQDNVTALCQRECEFYTPYMVFLCLCTVNSVADPIFFSLAMDSWLRQNARRLRWSPRHGRTKTTQLTASKDVEEPRLPTDSCTLPTIVAPPGAPQGTRALQRTLHEEPC
ncbi:PREDICTED: probable G-protein coupled receptor 132 [Condylura cristata]|uniref:probable G-protein coupled receptor 132 n=1 Tax=Condylura cristata TaxID=143302 RepID=UPI000643733B|nr:PREDICTED: probable G-protein coupled receptor 132 [Condylura cristata]